MLKWYASTVESSSIVMSGRRDSKGQADFALLIARGRLLKTMPRENDRVHGTEATVATDKDSQR